MLPRTTELPADLDPEELNEMIRDLGHEMGCPYWASPDLVELGEVPPGIYGYNIGCTPSGVEMYREGQKWRRKLIGELKRRSEWVAEWRAEREMDRKVEELCRQKGLVFPPWECRPGGSVPTRSCRRRGDRQHLGRERPPGAALAPAARGRDQGERRRAALTPRSSGCAERSCAWRCSRSRPAAGAA
jgi:hypothetical protein